MAFVFFFFFLLSLFHSANVKKKKENIDEKEGYSSVRRVVDQLEPRPWPNEQVWGDGRLCRIGKI